MQTRATELVTEEGERTAAFVPLRDMINHRYEDENVDLQSAQSESSADEPNHGYFDGSVVRAIAQQDRRKGQELFEVYKGAPNAVVVIISSRPGFPNS